MIIGISGRKQSGKDTIGRIIQYLLRDYAYIDYSFEQYFNFETSKTWQIKKFADKLKDMVCMLIGCTREQLEDETFKNTELGEEWWYFKGRNGSLISYNENSKRSDEDLIKPTPRLLMQLLGTECGREILHPNIWVNSVFADYRRSLRNVKNVPTTGMRTSMLQADYPNWIITDVRFPNEADAIKQRDGVIIRVNSGRCNNDDNHPSETGLDKYMNFDYIISNYGSIGQLIEKVRRILIKQELL